MKSKFMLTVVCVAALGSHAGKVHSQEQDDSRGSGQVISEPTENTLVAPAETEEFAIDSYSNSVIDASVEIQEFAIDGYSNSIIDANLQEQLDQMKGKDTIEVVIFLDLIMDDEESDFGDSGGATYLTDTNQLSNTEITTNDPELNYTIEGMAYEDQLALVQDKRTQQSDKHRVRRTEKSQKTVDQLLKKLKKKRFDRLISFDESAGIITAALKKNELKKLARFPEYILSITQYQMAEPMLTGVFDDIRLNTTAWPVSTFGGQGVGIYMNEWDNYCFQQSDVEHVESAIGLGGGNYNENGNTHWHANYVAQSLRAASPQSHIYCTGLKFSLPSGWRNNIHIVNYSWLYAETQNTAAWNSFDESADNFSYNENVLLFTGTGNDCNKSSSSCFVGSPAKSHNSLTQGAYNHRTNKMANFSTWRNPSTGARKPELLAPGVSISFPGLGSNSGTSYSAPLAAGMAASNISVIPGMKKHPALIKASMLAMATKTNISNDGNSQVDGARGIRWNPDGHYYWWDEPHTFLNDANGQWKLLKTVNLRRGENARIALSWSNRAEVCNGSVKGHSYTPPNSRLCLGIAMRVVDPNGKQVVYQNASNQNWQAADFYTGAAGNYKVYVWRTAHHFEWRKRYPWSGRTYYYNRAKLGLRIAYIDNW